MFNGIIEDLVFISKIPAKAKPNFSDKSYTLSDEWFSTLKRRYKSEKGEKGVIYVEELLDKIENYWRTWISDDQERVKSLLMLSQQGFRNLVATYTTEDQRSVAEGYCKCWERVKKWLTENSQTTRKKFFNYAPKITVSSHSSRDSLVNDK